MTLHPTAYLNVKHLVRDLGGRARVRQRLAEMGVPVSLHAIDRAMQRQSMHGHLLVNLVAHVFLTEGVTVDLPSYITTEAVTTSSRKRAGA